MKILKTVTYGSTNYGPGREAELAALLTPDQVTYLTAARCLEGFASDTPPAPPAGLVTDPDAADGRADPAPPSDAADAKLQAEQEAAAAEAAAAAAKLQAEQEAAAAAAAAAAQTPPAPLDPKATVAELLAIATERGIDTAALAGTGSKGAVTKKDLVAAISAAAR